VSNIFDALKKRQTVEAPVQRAAAPFPFQPATLTTGKPKGLSFRTLRELESLRERLEIELPRNGRRLFAISASATGEGASTLGLQLARIIARGGDGKVLLIDADTGSATRTLSRSIGSKHVKPGLLDLLGGRAELSKTVLSTDEPNLHFLPSGADKGDAREPISQERMRQFLDDMGKLYRMVILDCPPVLANPESPMIAALTEGVVLVVRANRTRREVTQSALALLQSAHCKVLGVVLNQRSYPIPGFLYRRL
jgi:capsular exopolysaccharide synthesis family protein